MDFLKFYKSIRSESPEVPYLTLMLIMLLALLLRICFLGSIPIGFYCDEASIGYDAFSILSTQCDRYGEFLPLFLRSFGDYREASYILMIIPSIMLLGLTEFAVRFPAAVIGALTVPVLFFLSRECFGRKVGLLSALFLAVSPWHILISRMALTGYTSQLFFLCLGLVFFLKAIKRKPPYILLSALSFSFGFWTYYSARVFIPLFVFGLSIIYIKDLWKIRKHALGACAIILSISIPLFLFWISPKGMARANWVLNLSFFKNISYYFSYLSPHYLFLKGDPYLRHSLRGMGQLYLFGIVTISAGLIGLIYRIKSQEKKVLLLWLLLYPIPAALTQPSHATRSFIGAPLFSILSAYGIFVLLSLFKSKQAKKLFGLTATIVIALSVSIFCKHYFLDYSKYSAASWQFGMREAIKHAENSPYDRVFISNHFNQGYIFALFYTKFPPLACQDYYKGLSNSFGKYQVRSVTDNLDFKDYCLFIMFPDEVSKIPEDKYEYTIYHIVKYPTGGDAVKIVLLKHKGKPGISVKNI